MRVLPCLVLCLLSSLVVAINAASYSCVIEADGITYDLSPLNGSIFDVAEVDGSSYYGTPTTFTCQVAFCQDLPDLQGGTAFCSYVSSYDAAAFASTTAVTSLICDREVGTAVGINGTFTGGGGNLYLQLLLRSSLVCPPLPSPSPAYIVSNTSNVGTMPGLYINLTTNGVTILPKDPSGKQHDSAVVSVTLGQLTSQSLTNVTVKPENAMWLEQRIPEPSGANKTFLFSSNLPPSSTNSTAGRLQLAYSLFANTTRVQLGTDSPTPVSFTISPAYVKLTVRIDDFPWQSSSDDDPNERVELRVTLAPAFSAFKELANTTPHVRIFSLSGQSISWSGGQAETRLQLVEAVELDGQLIVSTTVAQSNTAGGGRRAVEFSLDAERSELVLSFARFNHSLFYDPDLGVLLTKKDGGSSDDNTGLIIGVAVAVPLAVLVVLVVVASAIGYGYWRKHTATSIAKRGSVNFIHDD